MKPEPKLANVFRSIGLKLIFIPYLLLCWHFYKNYLITTDQIDFSNYQSIWLWSFRLSNVLLFPWAIDVSLTILFYSPPPLRHRSHQIRPKKAKVSALILRVITMGNYRKMIDNCISYHYQLIQKYFSYDHFSIHIVTETQLGFGGTYPKLVREILVPKSYQTPNGTVGKARNIAYWAETNQLGDLPEKSTWIVDIDEDVLLSESLMEKLANEFFVDQDKPKIGLPQVVIKLKPSDNFLNIIMQAFRFTIDLVHHWPALKLYKRPPTLCHGGCFVARADCSIDKTADCGPFCSMSEDNAYAMIMVSKRISLEFINGWFLEDAPTSVLAGIYQRARWQRGHSYLLLFLPVPWRQKVGLGILVMGLYLALPLACITRIFFFITVITGNPQGFLPAGPSSEFGIIDFLSASSTAVHAYAMVYGCWFVLPWRKAIPYSVLMSSCVPLGLLHCTDLIVISYATIILMKELLNRNVSFQATSKIEETIVTNDK